MDQVKGYALGAVIGMPILAGFLKVIEWAGKGFVPFLMLFMLVESPYMLFRKLTL